MARAFKSTPRGFTARLDSTERELLRGLFEDVATLLAPEDDGAAPGEEPDPLWAMVGMDPRTHAAEFAAPTDPAELRLLPDAVQGDQDASLEYRRLTETTLRERKIGALKAAALAMESSALAFDAAAANQFAQALNDVRLVLAERLDLRTEDDAERISSVIDAATVDDVDEYLALVYNFVTWLQETLMQALLGSL
ncbi:MAG: DUF2017 family protein [Arthrobacter sp.]|uniref:DUF2017 family protein n=1 Tax=unclassified Arthrobacter TaxID=235627 RepID=UPI00264EE328|nr:DUF2017 domain-containing protein [Micrococcaceae bacterium]MDN5811894.1 DUF2017 domain-containing protein [Micrococcaceae bacterium]MDN5823864.1 DUF2017 domain-containing protein [Micrococcaceae bacterium]MDN5878544.1 DUF2017 domain-containing protein [Micrococcaceae bacterium]MDN5886385.1 DUF2017 domain-containing protein [Micrococcaceae bacterium]